jgi:hypothetical protein
MKTRNWLLLTLAGMLILAACGPTTQVTKDDSYDISKVKTYTWVPAQRDSIGRGRNRTTELTNNKIKSSMDKNLQAAGWQMARRNADVYLIYETDVERDQRNVSDPVYSQPMTRFYYSRYRRGYVPVYYPSTLVGYDNRTQTVVEGTITLTVVDARTDKTIWQGSATSEIDGRRMTDDEIEANVKAIVKKLT